MFHHSQPSDNARLPKLLDSLSPNTHNLIQHLPHCCWLTNARGQQAFHPMPDTRYDPTWKTTYTDTETPDGNATLLIRQPSVFLKSLHWELMLNVVQLSKYATSPCYVPDYYLWGTQRKPLASHCMYFVTVTPNESHTRPLMTAVEVFPWFQTHAGLV